MAIRGGLRGERDIPRARFAAGPGAWHVAVVGLFDLRCPISGLSLRAADATHVALIEHEPGRWLPLTLPLTGCYDRLGSIDRLVPDFRTELFVAGFARLMRAGLLTTLDAVNGSTARAAEILDLSVRTIQYRLHTYGRR